MPKPKPDELGPAGQHQQPHDDPPGEGDELEREPGAEAEHESVTEDTEHAPEPIRLGQRIFLVGETGAGKSEALLNLFAYHGGQRILIDVQDHYVLGPAALAEDPPPLEIDDPAQIDWRHRTIRYIPRRAGDRREMERLHAAIFRRGNLFVACDEAEDVAPSTGGGSGMWVRKCIKQGRKVRITYGAATQRPVCIEPALRDQAEHMLVFPFTGNDDLKVISRRLGMSVDELSSALNQLGEYEYLRHTKGILDEHRRPLVLAMPALPAATVEFTRGHVINEEHR